MENNKSPRSILFFDLDGTLLDTSADIRACLANALSSNGFDTNSQTMDSLKIGPPLREMIKTLYPNADEGDLQKVVQTFRRLYDTSDYPQTVAYPGMDKLLAELAVVSDLYVATNKVYLPSLRLIQKFDWTPFFVDLLSPDRFGQTLQTKNELIEQVLNEYDGCRKDCVLIGDHPSDVAVAHATHISSVAVTWGYAPTDLLEKANPHALVSSAESLLNWIRSFLGRQGHE
jgi:phosphoglycolate phosphatase